MRIEINGREEKKGQKKKWRKSVKIKVLFLEKINKINTRSAKIGTGKLQLRATVRKFRL